ncbi:uncharacterized protein A1O9_02097 [Exophiala aquamarina CBS 119918]|uniref:Uncharacterized protein n=1 Tax=Exophiala aquamarina CBS 119918 TaxID=1182545 RepID=A0A072PKX7_9EURO|nr:uncharacterized protein A1O9_02097 [Exophiala aquamarina CBS 119918]KEF60536.1 hypothetical protein A1O9_02097 [Exophiala aquamarina CBS 119918]
MASRILGTREIPSEYWDAAQLVGRTPFMASMFDVRAHASYCMYVPTQHYALPRGEDASYGKMPLIVTVHGSGRRAERAREALVELADRTGAAVLAPLFPAGVGGDPNDSHNYKGLAYGGIRYDLVLLAMLDEVSSRWPGVDIEKIFLVGFSGGGQFVLRFFYLHPERVAALSVGAPGVVTQLNDGLAWPKGIQGVEEVFGGLKVNLSALRAVEHVQLIVGGNDIEEVGGGLLRWWREKSGGSDAVSRALGPSKLPNRKDALESLHREFQEAGIHSSFVVVDGAGHEHMKVIPKVIEVLEPLLRPRV